MSFESPIAVDVNVCVASFTETVDAIGSPELGLNGVL